MNDLKEKVVLVTGGSRGIGRAICLKFAKQGAKVIVNYNCNKDAAVRTCQEAENFGVNCITVRADLGKSGEVKKMFETAYKAFARIDILINNAGIWEKNPVLDLSEEKLKNTIDTNLLGCFYTIKYAVPYMIKQGSGSIINIASTAGQRGEAFYSPYAASKGALIALTKSLAIELIDKKIRFNCVAPGWVETDMTIPILQGSESGSVYKQIPMGRVADPAEIANPVLFLASDKASFITGEIFNVNGGAVLCG